MMAPDRLPCARCRLPRPVSRFAPDASTPPSRQGRSWVCVWCQPHVERERARREIPSQAELPLAPAERSEAERIFD